MPMDLSWKSVGQVLLLLALLVVICEFLRFVLNAWFWWRFEQEFPKRLKTLQQDNMRKQFGALLQESHAAQIKNPTKHLKADARDP